MLDPRFRRGGKLIEARRLLSARGSGNFERRDGRAWRLLEGTLGGAIPGHMVSAIRRHRRGYGFSFSGNSRRRRLGRWRFGRIRQQRMEGALGAIPGPIVHMIGRRDGRKLRHGAGLGAALFRHVRSLVVRRRHVNSQARGHLLDARFGGGGKIVEGWFRWRRGVHWRALPAQPLAP